MTEFSLYVGLPWKEKGRSPDGFDCWGLLAFVYAQELEVDLPSYHDRYVTTADRKALAALINGELGPWEEIKSGHEQAFDVVLMREGGDPRHVGLVVEPGRLLHIERDCDSVIARYRAGSFRHRIVGFYRYSPPGHE